MLITAKNKKEAPMPLNAQKTDVSKLLLASKNKNKIIELTDILAPLGIKIVSALDYDLPDVEETGNSFQENAQLKALSGFLHTGLPTLSDDSGLCVHSLNNAPGIFSARYDSNGNNMQKLLHNLEHLPTPEDRRAHFICHLCLALPQKNSKSPEIQHFEGIAQGYITSQISAKSGFGYDPIFSTKIGGKTWAEVPKTRKNAESHRGKALKNFIHFAQNHADRFKEHVSFP